MIHHILSHARLHRCFAFSVLCSLIAAIPSGGVVVNDVIFQFANVFAPFGGIGHSGLGNYHGRFSFDDFTFKRAVLRRDGSKLWDIYLR